MVRYVIFSDDDSDKSGPMTCTCCFLSVLNSTNFRCIRLLVIVGSFHRDSSFEARSERPPSDLSIQRDAKPHEKAAKLMRAPFWGSFLD